MDAAELYLRVIDLPLDQRGAALDRGCAGNLELRAAVEEMLRDAAEGAANSRFSKPPLGHLFVSDENRLQHALEQVNELIGTDKQKYGPYIQGKYLGEGGLGIVYEAQHVSSRAVRAIKVLQIERLSSRLNGLARLLREADAQVRVSEHPGIVKLHDVIFPKIDESLASDQQAAAWERALLRERPCLVMDLIVGPNLGTIIESGSLDSNLAVEILLGVARAVEHMHQQCPPIIHRDLKPRNILMENKTTPKLADFGLSICLDELLSDESHFSGTAEYMSPEQVAGQRPDKRSDIWSLGVILYEMLSGTLPFPCTTREEIQGAILNQECPSLEPFGIDAELAEVCQRCLKKKSDDRFQTAAALIEALEQWSSRNGKAEAATKRTADDLTYDDFHLFLDDVGDCFFGRTWLFDEVDAWTVHRDERALLIMADYGVGKSAFVARLIRDERWTQRVLAWHCCSLVVGQKTFDPAWFVRNLFAMLADRCPGFVEQIEGSAVRDALERCHNDPIGAFRDAIIEPLCKLSPPSDGMRFLVIDALDEALGWSGSDTSIVQVLAATTEYFPEWLRLVATTRGEPRVLLPLGCLRTHMIDAESQSNLDDLYEYVCLRLSTPNLQERLVAARLSADPVAQLLVERSEGKFLYLHLVFLALERDNLTLTDIDSLPPGMPGLYERFFKRHFPTSERYDAAKQVLKVLVATVGGEPLTRGQLVNASGLKRKLPAALGSLTQYLRERNELVHFQHASLSEWLVQPGHPFSVDARDGHLALAEMCRREFSDDENELSHYLLAHYPTHLIKASDEFENHWGELAGVLTTLRFLEGKAEAGMVFELAADFRAAQGCLPRKHAQRRLIELLHESLRIDAQFIARHPSALFQCLWNRGWWYDTPEAAVHYEIDESEQHSKRLPWNQSGPKLHELLGKWKAWKEQRTPDFCWLRSLRPEASLGAYRRRDFVLRGHMDTVNAVAFAPNGAWIASSSNDGTVRVWDTGNGQEVMRLNASRERANGVAFSHDSRRLVSAATDIGIVQLWDLQVGGHQRDFKIHRSGGRSYVAFSPDDRQVFAMSWHSVKCWDATSGKDLDAPALSEWGRPECISRDCKKFVFIEAGLDLRVVDVNRRKENAYFQGHTKQVEQVAFSPDGRWVASASFDKTIRVWDIESGMEIACLHGHDHWVMSVAWSEDGERLVSGGWDETVRIWEVSSGKQLACLAGHHGHVNGVAFSPDGRTVASTATDGTVRVWDTEQTGNPLRVRNHDQPISGLSFSPDGKGVVTAAQKSAWVWDVERGVPQTELNHEADIFQVEFMPDGQRILTYCWDGQIRLWYADGRMLDCWEDHPVRKDVGICVSPDGRLIASWGDENDNSIRIRNLETGKEQVCLKPFHVTQVVFAPDGEWIAAGQQGDAVHVWQTRDGHEIAVLGQLAPQETVQCVTFSPDGQRLAAGVSLDILIWDIATGKELLRLYGGVETIWSMSFSADGKQLIVAAARYKGSEAAPWSGTTTVWDVTQQKPLSQFEGTGDATAMTVGFGGHSVSSSLEAAILSDSTGLLMAWITGTLDRFQSALSGRVWAGVCKNHLNLFQLEGTATKVDSHAAETPLVVSERLAKAKQIKPTATTPPVRATPAPVERLAVTKQIKPEYLSGLSWHNDSDVSYPAICPACKQNASLRVRFGEGKAQTIKRPISEMRIKCFENTCTVDTGDTSGLYLLPNRHSKWHREKVCAYLKSIGSPFASHPSLKKIPTAKDLRSYIDVMEPADDSGLIEHDLNQEPTREAEPKQESVLQPQPPEVLEMLNSAGAAGWSATQGKQRKAILKHLPRLLTTGQRWEDLEKLLLDLRFLEAKAQAGMVLELVQDFYWVTAHMPEDRPERRLLRVLEKALRRDVYFLARHPDMVFQSLWNSCWWYDCPPVQTGGQEELLSEPQSMHRLLEAWRDEKRCSQPGFHWLRSLRPPITRLETSANVVLRGHEGGVNGAAFLPHGRLVCSAGNDGTLRIWDTTGGSEVLCEKGHDKDIYCFAVSPDGKRAATGSTDHSIGLWRGANGRLWKRLTAHSEIVYGVAVSPDGKLLASASHDRTIRIWEAKSGREVGCLRGHSATVVCVAFSSDGKLLASGSGDHTVKIWEIRNAKELAMFLGHEETVASVCFSPDGRFLASASDDGTIRLWAMADHRTAHVLRGHTGWVVAVAFSPDGSLIASGGQDRTIRIWELSTGKEWACLKGHQGTVRSVAFSADGLRLLSSAADGTVQLWNLGSRSTQEEVADIGHCDRVDSLRFSQDGRYLASHSWDKTVCIWDVASAQLQFRLRGEDSKNNRFIDTDDPENLRHKGPHRVKVEYSPDDQIIAFATVFFDEVQLWDAQNRRLLASLEPSTSDKKRLAFSPDGQHLACCFAESHTLRVWNVATRQEVFAHELSDREPDAVEFSADGQTVACWSRDTLHLVDAHTGNPISVVQFPDPATTETDAQAKLSLTVTVGRGDTAFRSSATAEPVAWFPAEFHEFAAHPNGLLFAGANDRDVYLLTLDEVHPS